MRILQVIRSMSFGGAENHVISLALGLRQLGHETLLAAPERSWVANECARHDIPVTPLAMRGLADIVSYWRLHRLARTWRADILHAHQVRPAQYAGIAAIATGAIPICTAHSAGARKHMRRCRHIIAVSDAVLQNLLDNGYPRTGITRIYNGVAGSPPEAIAARAATRAELGIPDGQFALVCAARFNPQKGQDFLVRVVKNCPANVHAYLVGDANTAFGCSVREIADGHPRIHFMGYRNDIPRILPAFDAYVSPSRAEAFSLSLAEAASAELPAIATRVGGVPEVVLDGETGILVNSGDYDALLDAIEQLATNPALARQMATRARQRHANEFTIEHMVAQTEQLYQRLLKTRK